MTTSDSITLSWSVGANMSSSEVDNMRNPICLYLQILKGVTHVIIVTCYHPLRLLAGCNLFLTSSNLMFLLLYACNIEGATREVVVIMIQSSFCFSPLNYS